MSIIIPISAFQSSDRRYFRMCPGHGHAPRAILFRDIMLDSSSFLPSDILVAIASNPLRQSVSAIRTPHGLLFPLPSSSSFSLFSPFLLFSTLSLSLLLLSFFVYSSLYTLPPSLYPFLYQRFRSSASLLLRFIFPPRTRCFSHFVSLCFSFRLFVPFLCSLLASVPLSTRVPLPSAPLLLSHSPLFQQSSPSHDGTANIFADAKLPARFAPA